MQQWSKGKSGRLCTKGTLVRIPTGSVCFETRAVKIPTWWENSAMVGNFPQWGKKSSVAWII